jgi:hypothetical protein
MKFETIDSRLFAITNALPEELTTPLDNLDWLSIPWIRQEGQQDWLRRRLDCADTPLANINEYIANNLQSIGDAVGVKFAYADTYWWIDEPGFTVGIHTDGHLPSSMQLFWIMPTEQHGTVFYNSKDPSDVKKAFSGVTNTGYLMLNGQDPDGFQPLQWHGMLTPVPDNTIRVCSYTIFGPYENKYTYERN